jgi:hypothetical protein
MTNLVLLPQLAKALERKVYREPNLINSLPEALLVMSEKKLGLTSIENFD